MEKFLKQISNYIYYLLLIAVVCTFIYIVTIGIKLYNVGYFNIGWQDKQKTQEESSLSELKGDCTQDIPIGMTEKSCLEEKNTKLDVEIEEKYKKLIKNSQQILDNHVGLIGSEYRLYESLRDRLEQSNEILPNYIEARCELESLQMYGGTGEYGIYLLCENSIKKQYLDLLETYEVRYIDK